MSENEIIPEAVSKEESENTLINETKKDKKKFSILLVSANNDANLEIEGKISPSINNTNNLITFSKNIKKKKSLNNVIKEIKDINENLDGLQSNLSKTIKTFRSKPYNPITNSSRIINASTNNYMKSDNHWQMPKLSNSSNTKMIPVNNNSEFENDRYNNRTYLLERENKRLKEMNRQLENEIEDYKKYLDNMAHEKKQLMQSIKMNSKLQKTYNTDNEEKTSKFLRYRDPRELYNSTYKNPVYYCNQTNRDDNHFNNQKRLYKSDNF